MNCGKIILSYNEKEFPVQPWNSPRKTKGIVDAAQQAVQKVIFSRALVQKSG